MGIVPPRAIASCTLLGRLVRGKAPKEQEVRGRAEVVPAKLLIIFNGRSVPQSRAVR